MKTVTIDIVRHGQTFLNVLDRMQGWCDYDLNQKGYQQALLTGKALKQQKYNLIVSSDLRRAVQTRDQIVSQLNHRPGKVTIDPAFREMCFGVFEGLDSTKTWAKISHQFGFKDQPDVMRHCGMIGSMNLLHQADPSGESDDAATVSQRWSNGIFDIMQSIQDGGRALIVTHGTFIRALAENMGINTLHNYPVNAGVTTISADEFGHLKMLQYNQHFE